MHSFFQNLSTYFISGLRNSFQIYRFLTMQEDPLGFLAQTIMFGSVSYSLQSSLLKIERSISCRIVGNSPPENTVLDKNPTFFSWFLVVHGIQQSNLCFKYLIFLLFSTKANQTKDLWSWDKATKIVNHDMGDLKSTFRFRELLKYKSNHLWWTN